MKSKGPLSRELNAKLAKASGLVTEALFREVYVPEDNKDIDSWLSQIAKVGKTPSWRDNQPPQVIGKWGLGEFATSTGWGMHVSLDEDLWEGDNRKGTVVSGVRILAGGFRSSGRRHNSCYSKHAPLLERARVGLEGAA